MGVSWAGRAELLLSARIEVLHRLPEAATRHPANAAARRMEIGPDVPQQANETDADVEAFAGEAAKHPAFLVTAAV